MNLNIFNTSPLAAWSCVAIVIAAIVVYFWFRNQRQSGKLVEKRRWIESLPSLLSTLGVLGTFLGITIGLLNFNPEDLDKSIPDLLDGLKTAFFTSLTGMICSLILSRIISSSYDEQDGGISDINQASGEIVKAVKEMSESNTNTLKALKEQAEQTANAQTTFYNMLGNILTSLKSDIGTLNTNTNSVLLQAQSQATSLNSLLTCAGNIEEELPKSTQGISRLTEGISKVENNILELTDIQNAIASTDEEIRTEVHGLGQKLHDEVVEIEDNMQKTNALLVKKFNEFSELLQKSNTEALVEVMKKVTEEFQKQMNDLISRLVQENFEQLNNSVERLNQWQIENKEMIASLTAQYREMAENFSQTGSTLAKVGTDTQLLVSDGGKLRQIIDSLSQILIEDKKFIQISQKLESTVSLTQSNMQQFDESTRSLNDWVRKQRNFVDGVNALILKLEELNSLRNYSDEFWKETRKGMNDGISIIRDGSEQLNTQLTNLDNKFYSRLNATLAELDTCIQAMVNGHKDRRG